MWPTNDFFVALTQCDKQVLTKWKKNAKKVDTIEDRKLRGNAMLNFFSET